MPDTQSVKFVLDLTWPMMIFGAFSTIAPTLVLCWKVSRWVAELTESGRSIVAEVHTATAATDANRRSIEELTISVDSQLKAGSERFESLGNRLSTVEGRLGL